jgi:hypothetical protein
MGGSRGTSPVTAQPKAHGAARRNRGEGRLDPVRWHRPVRGTLLRLAAVAALLATAAVASWSPTRTTCADETGAAATPPSVAAPPSSAATPAAVPPGSVGVPVRLADPTALTLVRPGNRVDLLRVDDPDGDATAVATAALVLKVTGAGDPTAGGLLLALSPAEAGRAVAAPGHGFAILIRPG